MMSLVAQAAPYAAAAVLTWFVYVALAHGRVRLLYYYRTFWYYALMLFGSLHGIVRVPFTQRHDRLSESSRWYYNAVSYFTGLKIQVENAKELKPHTPCVYMINHQTSLDMFCCGGFMPPGTVVIAKRSLKYVPFLGQFLTVTGSIYVDRANHDSAMQSMERAGRELQKSKAALIIFPEGTRSRSEGELLPFKKGGFNLAVAAQVPIVPVVIAQQKPVYDPKRHRFLPGVIAVKVLSPITTAGLTRDDVPALADTVRDQMGAILKTLVAVPDAGAA